ncbi:CaiB/BaiF CoA transferase family protein [Polynucleobacter sinensis]|uniref:CaiB/BaiF CoA transferase family protein n=1 Tax=Polynucleobacter sinensis TaxID=1743157 RepID=UPI0009EF349A|nr:CoA transferase [Polynucleobacter sinensis]
MSDIENTNQDSGLAPLSNVTVIDLSRLVSGNMMTHVLADMGAKVIKVESPGKGDELRSWQRQGVSTYWAAYARNKDSVCLNLREPDGLDSLKNLLSNADILVENFRPGTLEKMGLGRDALELINPRLIVVRISGWGQTGLFAERGGFGSLIEAMSGFASMNGFADRPPVLPPFAMADSVAGIYGASVALALLHQQKSNQKPSVKEVDLSLFEPLFSILGPQAAEYQLTGAVTPRSGSRSPTHAPRNVYQTKDEKWIALSAGMEGTLVRLFEGIGYPEGLKDARFSTHEARLKNIDALDGLIQSHISKLSLDEALDFFKIRDITAGQVCDIADLISHPYMVDREMLVETQTAEGPSLLIHAVPYKINGQRPAIRRAAPTIGQDNDQWIAKKLGDVNE